MTYLLSILECNEANQRTLHRKQALHSDSTKTQNEPYKASMPNILIYIYSFCLF